MIYFDIPVYYSQLFHDTNLAQFDSVLEVFEIKKKCCRRHLLLPQVNPPRKTRL